MLRKKSEIQKVKVGDIWAYQDDYIGKEFVMDFLDVKESKAYSIINEIRKHLKKKHGYILMQGRATLSGFFEMMGLKGKFE